MTILQAGKAKSGNYWLYKIIQTSFELSGLPPRTYIEDHPIHREAQSWTLSHSDQAKIDVISLEPGGVYFRIGQKFRRAIPNIDTYLSRSSHVWTHSAFCEQQRQVYKKFDKIVYLVRDPRDVAVSMSRFAFTPYMIDQGVHRERNESSYLRHRLHGSVLHWVAHVGGHLLQAGDLKIHFVFFERLKRDFRREAGALLRYLDLAMEDDRLARLEKRVSFATMSTENPEHVRSGEAYGWAEVLDHEQVEAVMKIAGPMLNFLHYPTHRPIEVNSLPRLPERVESSVVESIIAQSRGSLIDQLGYGRLLLKSGRPIGEKWRMLLDFLLGRALR
jgi:aryl sulfotransferase